jgi:hypothetical protein
MLKMVNCKPVQLWWNHSTTPSFIQPKHLKRFEIYDNSFASLEL